MTDVLFSNISWNRFFFFVIYYIGIVKMQYYWIILHNDRSAFSVANVIRPNGCRIHCSLIYIFFQSDQSSRRIKRDKTSGRRRCTFHGDPWSFVVERTEAQQRGHFARHRTHSRNANIRFRIRSKFSKFVQFRPVLSWQSCKWMAIVLLH